MKISSINVSCAKHQPSFAQKKNVKDSQNVLQSDNKKSAKFKKALPYIIALEIGAMAFGAGILLGSKRGDKISKIFKKTPNTPPKNDKLALALLALAGYGTYAQGKINQDDVDKKLDSVIRGDIPSQRAISSNAQAISDIKRTQTNSTVGKYAQYFNDILLLRQDNAMNRNAQRYDKAIETIETIGQQKLTSTEPLPKLDKENPVIWSITSEFAPIKEGGLGSVPPEVRNNVEKMNVSMPTFVPMYLNDGTAGLSKTQDGYVYTFKGKSMPLKKLATIQTDVYKNAKSRSIPVSYYLYEDYDREGTKRQLVFIQASDYFDGTIYEANAKTEEPEKFAIMSKAVYEFAKLKMDGLHSSKNVEIFDDAAYKSIQEPDGMILNDWQASPVAALLRYKAPMENAYSQISDQTAQKLRDMRVITIGHNVMYQGSSQNNNDYHQKKATTSNILNTLFDKYAYDIVTHAKSGATSLYPDDEGLSALDNVLVMEYDNPVENYTNFLNMGIILSDYFNPVSKNYTKELISPEHRDLSYMLQWALVQKNKAGKLVGVINGNDYKNLSLAAKEGDIQKTTGLNFRIYEKGDSTSSITEKRLQNKVMLYEDFILPFSESSSSSSAQIEKVREKTAKLEFYRGKRGLQMPSLTKKELENTPVLMSGGRLVSQKGVGLLCDAIKMLYDNWDKDFPNKNKPIIYIAGADGEGGTQRKLIEDLKNERLSEEDSSRIAFIHGRAPMAALMSASDYFLMPSLFEPCGLMQSESLALATPVVASAVGGIVDTINRSNKFNGFLTDKDKPLDAQAFYETMKKALSVYFDDKTKYNQMVRDSIDEDFSWNRGPIQEYLSLLGIDR